MIDASVFEKRAQSFFTSMRDLVTLGGRDWNAASPDYRSAVGLLAVHSAISFSDFLMVLSTGATNAGAHDDASDELRAAMKSRRIECGPISKLDRLLGQKHHFAYSPRSIKPAEVHNAVIHAQSFAAWALEAANKLREGW